MTRAVVGSEPLSERGATLPARGRLEPMTVRCDDARKPSFAVLPAGIARMVRPVGRPVALLGGVNR